MHPTNTINEFQFRFSEPSKCRPVNLWNVGWETRSTQSYDLDNMKRPQDNGTLVFQYTLSGIGKLEFEDKTYTLRKNDAFFISIPGNHRYYYPGHSDPWEFIYLTLTGSVAEQVFDDIIDKHGPVVSLLPDTPVIQSLLAIYTETVAEGIRDPYEASSQSYGFLMECLRFFINEEDNNVKMPHKLNQVIRFLDENYHASITLEDMAEYVNISKYTLIKMFKDHLQTTPIQYLTNFRIRRAAKLLHRSNKSVKQIAEEVGYTNSNYFNKSFRKVTGVTPSEFRMNCDFSLLVKN